MSSVPLPGLPLPPAPTGPEWLVPVAGLVVALFAAGLLEWLMWHTPPCGSQQPAVRLVRSGVVFFCVAMVALAALTWLR